MKKNESGITLIALVVTIVVLLILAGISISMLTGENGIINKTGLAKEKTEIGREKEIVELAAVGAASKNDYGEITEENLEIELNEMIGTRNEDYKLTQNEGKFIVTYIDSNRSYEIDENGRVAEIEFKEPEEGDRIIPISYGVIEVEFLEGTSYNTTSIANPPKKTAGMKAVYWDEEGNEIVEGDPQFKESEWYNYIPQTTYTENGGTSKWANAKTEDGSYWVWIPRYAYRIVYFDTPEHTDAYRFDNSKTEGITGYSDARGMINIDGTLMSNISDTKTAIAVNDKEFRTHPAFETDIDQGGWDTKLTGIWVAKFEMSAETSTDNQNWSAISPESSTLLTTNAGNTSSTQYRAVSKPGVSSWRNLYVGTMYSNGYYYDRDSESHMIKNSEWGAVAYLADSRYGRNGTEVTANNSNSYITGNAGDTVNADSAPGVINAYNTKKGGLASTTGNIYGVYDMSGGTREYVAAFDSAGTERYLSNYASSFASLNGTSTKYATAYYNPSSINSEDFTLGKVSIMGDAIQEIYLSGTIGWNQDYVNFISTRYPFFTRGGAIDVAGLFLSYSVSGINDDFSTFRVVLAP